MKPTLAALVAGVAHLMHREADSSDCAPWRRAAIGGTVGESGIAAALVLLADRSDRSVRDEYLRRLLHAAERLLPLGSNARSACAALCEALTNRDARRGAGRFGAVAALLQRDAVTASIMAEVDECA